MKRLLFAFIALSLAFSFASCATAPMGSNINSTLQGNWVRDDGGVEITITSGEYIIKMNGENYRKGLCSQSNDTSIRMRDTQEWGNGRWKTMMFYKNYFLIIEPQDDGTALITESERAGVSVSYFGMGDNVLGLYHGIYTKK